MNAPDQGVCCACGAADLHPHLRVAGDAGAEGLIPSTDRYGSALADIVRCARCGHMQLDRMPSDAELGEAYGEAASEDYIGEEAGQRATARAALEQIERSTGGPGALLDLGCWVGFLLVEARERGWRTLGVEPSEFASAYARDRHGLDVMTADLLTAPVPEGAWDAVVLGDVIEHLPRPGDALDRIAQLLRPGGVVYMALPDAGSRLARAMGARWWSVLPTHVQYFTRESLVSLLRRQGYEPLIARTSPKAYTVRYYLERLGGYSRPVADGLVRAATAAGIAERIWAPDFRDRMAVIARAPATSTLPARMQIDPGIFKAYDIRGLYGEQIDEDVAYLLGRAFARVLGDLESKPVADLRVGVGRDMRLTAPALTERYVAGIRDEGASVIDAGMVGTEMLYFLVGSRDLDGGLMCTASHNPKAYTGAKLVRRGALALSGDAGIGEMRDLVASGEFGDPADERGGYEEADVYPGFKDEVLGFIEASRVSERRVTLDGGNGMAGPMVGPVLDELPLEREELYWEPNGEFPDHEPNPLLEENRKFIIDKVLETGADLGIAWDGDADRCFFIDNNGTFVDGDFLTALLAESVLQKEPGATILYDVRASRAVKDTVERAGGTALINRVGHAFFKTRMREIGAAFGGEVSGHYYFRDFYCADSGTLPALLILELLSQKGKSMGELMEAFRSTYFISGEINSEVADQQAKIDEIKSKYSDGEITELDGVSVDYEDWHFNVRPSNTEPLLRLNLESLVSREHMEEKRDEVLALIRG